MLTNEEALAIINRHDECYVVWATDRNAIVAVHPIPTAATVEDRFSALTSMQTDYKGPTKGRFLSGSKTTLQTLIDESRETDRIAARVTIFNSWLGCTIGRLIDILKSADFHEPMDAFHGSQHIVERIYKIHGRQLTPPDIEQLREFAYTTAADPEQKSAQNALQCYLSVLSNDQAQLKAFWQQHHSPNVEWSSWSPFTSAAGDIHTDDQQIIDQLIAVVGTPFMFGPRFEAMVALGKIGQPAGPKAAKVIVDSIYDSSEAITSIRNRVIRRIQSSASEWACCAICYNGYVNGTAYGIPSTKTCGECFGIGNIPKAA